MSGNNVLRCLYGLPNVNISFSVEFFPPKCIHAIRTAVGGYLTARDCVGFKFVSLTCGASGADKHNSYKLLLALSLFIETKKILIHLIQVDKSLEVLTLFIKRLKQLGVNKILLLKGDYYVDAQIRPDAANDFLFLTETRLLSLFCAITNYPEVHILGKSSRCERTLAAIKRSFGCSYSFTQFFNVVETFIKANIRMCLLTKLLNIPGFVISVKRPLGCRTSVRCGVYIPRFIKSLILIDCDNFRKRNMMMYTITKVYIMLINNIRWLHVFALNKFRTFHKLTWLFSLSGTNLG
ncbi:5,10-methylenetetrahydrofolate reductase [Candidatus Hodgkinia cicadicola]|nr:5,10-methylenetetrahydrofolate reductase [Candidatus Hodgkinia cicadicola]